MTILPLYVVGGIVELCFGLDKLVRDEPWSTSLRMIQGMKFDLEEDGNSCACDDALAEWSS